MTAKMESGWYIVDDPNQGKLNGTKIYISSITEPETQSYIPGKKIVQGGITFSEKSPYKNKTATLGNRAFIFESTYDKNILLTDWNHNLFNAIIVPYSINEGGRRRKTFRNKRKLRLRKTKSANKRR